MLTTVSQLSPRAKAVHARASATRILGPASSAVIRHRHQTRAFRLPWGWCSSHEDAENHREIRRRHRMLRHKYAESLNRKLSWEQHPEAEEARRTFRRLASPHWVFRDGTRSGAYYTKVGKTKTTPDNPKGVRPGRNIEDVERGAMDHFLFGDADTNTKWSEYEYDRWTAPLQNIRNYMANRQEELRSSIFGTSETSTSSHAQADQARESASASYSRRSSPAKEEAEEAEEDYVIDPITNRKVSKSAKTPVAQTENDVPEGMSRRYRSQFDQFQAPDSDKPIFCDGPPPPSELRQYRQVEIDDDALIQSEHQATAGSATADSDLPPSADELHRYSQVEIDDVDSAAGPSQRAVSGSPASSESVDAAPTAAEMREYRNVILDENPSDHVAEHSTPRVQGRLSWEPIIESDGYIQNHEPDFDIAHGPEQTYLSWKYKSMSKRGEGEQVSSTAAQSSVAEQPKYEDLDRYKPVMYNETASAEPATPTYSDLEKYEAAIEPDLERPVDPTPAYEDLGKYNAFRYHEPDGKQPEQVEAEEAPEDAKLYKPFLYNEPDGKPLGAEEQEQEYDAAELRKYGAFRWNEPDGQPAFRDDQEHRVQEAKKYKPVMYNEPDGKPQACEADSVDSTELGGYGALRYHEPDGKPIGQAAETAADTAELGKYKAVRHNEPDGKAAVDPDSVTEGLKEFDSSANNSWISQSAARPEVDESYAGILRKLERLSSELKNEEEAGKSASAQPERQAASKWDTLRDDTLFSRGAGLRGNYVQDFPEEFARTWTSSQDTSATLKLKDTADAVESSSSVDGSASVQQIQTECQQSSSTSSSMLEPSLNRQQSSTSAMMSEADRAQALADPYSKEPQGLETSYVEECDGKPTWPTFVKIHKCTNEASNDQQSELAGTAALQDADSLQVGSTEPTVYKILAYDPTMQTINVAETTSVVPDTASALTPAEVLLRLSNPSKFFPHFAPLQAQGFEIVSGSGDVLVFRKVHDVATATPTDPEAAAAAASSSAVDTAATTTKLAEEQPSVHHHHAPPAPAAAAVNPIDMTGTRPFFPAAANFASPTGYVNYDMPSLADGATLPPPPAPAPRFRSNIDVRREEPVFSGRKSGDRGEDKDKRPHVGKRMLVGAVWVASVSYAIGVVGEYFKTGGIDGVGPKGF